MTENSVTFDRRQEVGNGNGQPEAGCRNSVTLGRAVCLLPSSYWLLELILVFVLVVIFFNDIQFDRVEADDL